MDNPTIEEIIDFVLMLTSLPLTEEVQGLIERYEAGEITLGEVISCEACTPSGDCHWIVTGH